MPLSPRLPRDNAPRFPSEAECPPRVHSSPKRPQGEQKGKTWMMTLNIEPSTAAGTRACVAETAESPLQRGGEAARDSEPDFFPPPRDFDINFLSVAAEGGEREAVERAPSASDKGGVL